MKHPARHFIYYLLSKRRFTNAEILQILGDRGYSFSRGALREAFVLQLESTRRSMAFPSDFDPGTKPFNKNTEQFLQKWKIRDLHIGRYNALAAAEILESPPARRFIKILLLGPLEVDDIARYFRHHFGSDRDVSPGIVKLFAHYYWNQDTMDGPEWEQFLSDDNVMAQTLSAPRDAAGAAVSLMAAGVSGTLTPAAMFQTTRDQFFRMFMQHSTQKASLPRAQSALAMFQGLVGSEDQLNKYRGGSAELLNRLAEIETLYNKDVPPTLATLPERLRLPIVDTTGEVIEERRKNDV